MHLRSLLIIAIGGGCTALAGCGGAEKATHPNVVQAGGVVTHGGAPVEGATVVLMSEESKKAGWVCSGKSDAAGKFAITSVFAPGTDAKGIPAGDYTAVVTKFDFPSAVRMDMKAYEEQLRLKQTNSGIPAQSSSPKSLLPPIYGTDSTSSLKVRIDGSGNPNIELKLLN
jgi:hypothetical protein